VAYSVSDASILVGLDGPAWKRIASRAFLSHEVVPLIEATLMSQDEVKTIGNLCGDDAQNFIDVIHEVPSHPFVPEARSDYPCPLRLPHSRTPTAD